MTLGTLHSEAEVIDGNSVADKMQRNNKTVKEELNECGIPVIKTGGQTDFEEKYMAATDFQGQIGPWKLLRTKDGRWIGLSEPFQAGLPLDSAKKLERLHHRSIQFWDYRKNMEVAESAEDFKRITGLLSVSGVLFEDLEAMKCFARLVKRYLEPTSATKEQLRKLRKEDSTGWMSTTENGKVILYLPLTNIYKEAVQFGVYVEYNHSTRLWDAATAVFDKNGIKPVEAKETTHHSTALSAAQTLTDMIMDNS